MHRLRLGLALAACTFAVACHSSSGGGSGSTGPVVLSGPQTGSLSIDLATGTAQVTAQPQALELDAQAAYDAAAERVTVTLGTGNNSTATLHNAKLLVRSLSEGSVVGDGVFGPAGGVAPPPYVYLGPSSIAPGESTANDFVIEGVTGAQPVLSIDFELAFHPWLFTPGGYRVLAGEDASGSGQRIGVDLTAFGFFATDPDGSHDTQFQPALASDDGRFVYLTCRNQPAVAVLDTTTMAVTLSNDLTGGVLANDGTGSVGHVSGLSASPDGSLLYAVLNHTHSFRHNQTYPPTTVDLVVLNEVTLSIAATLTVFEPATGVGTGEFLEFRGRKLSVTADGAFGALPITRTGLVAYIDLADLQVAELFDVSGSHLDPRFAAISPDGGEVYIAYNSNDLPSDGTLDVLDVATGLLSPLSPPTPGAANFVGALEFGPDGRLYYGRNHGTEPGLSIYDPATGTWVEQPEARSGSGVAFAADGSRYYVHDNDDGDLHVFDAATDAPLPFDASGLSSLPNAGGGFGHGLVVTD